jgi:hypothetical protein
VDFSALDGIVEFSIFGRVVESLTFGEVVDSSALCGVGDPTLYAFDTLEVIAIPRLL